MVVDPKKWHAVKPRWDHQLAEPAEWACWRIHFEDIQFARMHSHDEEWLWQGHQDLRKRRQRAQTGQRRRSSQADRTQSRLSLSHLQLHQMFGNPEWVGLGLRFLQKWPNIETTFRIPGSHWPNYRKTILWRATKGRGTFWLGIGCTGVMRQSLLII